MSTEEEHCICVLKGGLHLCTNKLMFYYYYYLPLHINMDDAHVIKDDEMKTPRKYTYSFISLNKGYISKSSRTRNSDERIPKLSVYNKMEFPEN